MDKIKDLELRQAWSYFDSVTAYGCTSRNEEFDIHICRNAWERYKEVVQIEFPMPIGL